MFSTIFLNIIILKLQAQVDLLEKMNSFINFEIQNLCVADWSTFGGFPLFGSTAMSTDDVGETFPEQSST